MMICRGPSHQAHDQHSCWERRQGGKREHRPCAGRVESCKRRHAIAGSGGNRFAGWRACLEVAVRRFASRIRRQTGLFRRAANPI